MRQFLASEAAGGVVLMVAAAAALIVANSPMRDVYFHMLHMRTGPMLNPALGAMTVHLWINDALMALFFLLVGLEIKRELVDGQLRRWSRRRLPFAAAAAGMIVPALIYLMVVGGDPVLSRGWAVPAATDIAFAIGVLALLGKRAPASLKLLLTTIAIVDDMGAVVIIALAYTESLDPVALAGALAVAGGLYLFGRAGLRSLPPYMLGFALLWLLVLMSGVHATVAGVIAAMMIPVTPSPGAPDATDSPLHRLEHALHPWVTFAIVPLFAFANAGVALGASGWAVLMQPPVVAVVLGLFLGKQIGILGGVYLAESTGFARRPGGVSWRQVYGVALVAGIGFTMSLFIGGLAFSRDPAAADAVRVGVLAGSALSGAAGYLVLRFGGRRTVEG